MYGFDNFKHLEGLELYNLSTRLYGRSATTVVKLIEIIANMDVRLFHNVLFYNLTLCITRWILTCVNGLLMNVFSTVDLFHFLRKCCEILSTCTLVKCFVKA